jgi:hypothetical protein
MRQRKESSALRVIPLLVSRAWRLRPYSGKQTLLHIIITAYLVERVFFFLQTLNLCPLKILYIVNEYSFKCPFCIFICRYKLPVIVVVVNNNGIYGGFEKDMWESLREDGDLALV